MDEAKLAHLGMIQDVVNRLATTSASFKGLAVTVLSAVFVLSNKDSDKMYVTAAYMPIVAFWMIDAYYLAQERSYRRLFAEVASRPTLTTTDFRMQSTVGPWDWSKAVFAVHNLLFYSVLVISLVLVVMLNAN